ncbi:MAG: ECF transporter S component [candidate division KSB1 bacterium]|nr:ECF transporter S component [candidate division KSB1 bacterium]
MPLRKLTRIVVLLTLTLIIQLFGLPQLITGPLINMMLLITALILDPLSGILLGMLTPLVALFRGQLPPLLAPMVPFIIVGNAIWVGVFALIRPSVNRNLLSSVRTWIALLTAALLKTLWLFATARFLLPLLLGKHLPDALIAAMSFPQFITAVAGGAFALALYNLLYSRVGLRGSG